MNRTRQLSARAADLFRPVFDATGGVDGWVSMEISPLLADDTSSSIVRFVCPSLIGIFLFAIPDRPRRGRR
jgi:hypothetical protein